MRIETVTLTVGQSIWYDGASWSIGALTGSSVHLIREGSQMLADIADVLQSASPSADPDPAQLEEDHLASVGLASLTSKQRAELNSKCEVLQKLLDAGPGTRRTEHANAARDLNISERTLRRMVARYQSFGPAGLIDQRLLQSTRRGVDPRWDSACERVLETFTNSSTPTMSTVIARTNAQFLHDVPHGTVPSRATAHRRLIELDAGKRTFGEAKQRRSVAKRPQGVLGQLQPVRPGEYILMDGYRMDVFAMEPGTQRWVNTELTVAMDLFDRSIKGIRLRPVAAKSADVASVLFQCMTPQRWGRSDEAPQGPYAGIPDHVVLGSQGTFPDTIVVDHGKVYLSDHTHSVCRRLGISIQPAIPNKPTDKPAIERFFRSLRQSLLDKLPGYKGPNIASRGQDIEKGAFYYVSELEQIIREWVGSVYHRKAHRGLIDPLLPGVDLSPEEMFNRGLQISGTLTLPSSEDLRFEFLDVEWRQIHHYGIDIDGRRYDGEALNAYRGTRSEYGGAHPGKWPFHVDVDDIRTVYFRDPHEHTWHELTWRAAGAINAPFSKEAAAYTRKISLVENRHVDPQQAVEELLLAWSREEVEGRRAKVLAQRLATQRAIEQSPDPDADPQEIASNPGVLDFFAHRPVRNKPEPVDELDVFEAHFAQHPEDTLEAFDE